MLESMRTLALCHLFYELSDDESVPESLDQWFENLREVAAEKLFPFLVEPLEKIEKVYVLEATDEPNVARLSVQDLCAIRSPAAGRIPFNKPSGPNSAQLGPVIKRTYSKQKGAGPLPKILESTLSDFKQIAASDNPWHAHFAETVNVLSRPKLLFGDECFTGSDNENAFTLSVKHIPENKTVILTIKDHKGRFPGEVPEYAAYLSKVLAETKYATGLAPPAQLDQCPLCETKDVIGFSCACKGAGLNLSNLNRAGAFPGLQKENAIEGYPLCLNCADLLYIYKFNVLPKFTTRIAGSKCVLVPNCNINGQNLSRVTSLFKSFAQGLQQSQESAVSLEKRSLLRHLADNRAVTSIDMMWATFGNEVSDVKGLITDIVPSRLQQLAESNRLFTHDIWPSFPFAPQHSIDDFHFDLQLSFIYPILKRPGGKRAKHINQGQRLFEICRLMAACLYHKTAITPYEKRLWHEILDVGRWHLDVAQDNDHPQNSLLYEGYSEKKGTSWLTLAGWIKHVALVKRFFQYTQLTPKEKNMRTYTPETPQLQPYFSEDSGINNDEKAFAFILGVVYGRVMQVQAARGVNVGANALTWLKRLNLSGRDLPEFFLKIREKLLAYEADKSQIVRDVMSDLAKLGTQLGNDIQLSQIDTCYFLLLGQAVANPVFRKEEVEEQVDNQ